jgi:hypothetical protein
MYVSVYEYTISFDMGLTSAEGQRIEYTKYIANCLVMSIEKNLVNPLCNKVMQLFYLTFNESVCILMISME